MNRKRILSDLVGSSWIALIVISGGLLTAGCFLYVALRSHKRSWMIPASVYSLLSLGAFLDWVLFNDVHGAAPPIYVFVVILVILWFAGLTNALVLNPEWLRIRRRLRAGVPIDPPAPVVVSTTMQLGATLPTDMSTAEHGPVLNQAASAELAELSGIDAKLAERLVDERQRRGPYTTGFDVLKRVPIPRGTAEGLLARVSIRLPEQTKTDRDDDSD